MTPEQEQAHVRGLEDAHEAADAAAYEARVSGYNGWRNWETWSVGLYLSNDEPTYRAAVGLVGLARLAPDPAAALAEALRLYVRALADMHGGTWADCTRAELRAVDWGEIAAAWLED